MLEKHLLSIEKEDVPPGTTGGARYRVRQVNGDFTGCVAVGDDGKLFVVDFSGPGSTCDEMELVFNAVLGVFLLKGAFPGQDD